MKLRKIGYILLIVMLGVSLLASGCTQKAASSGEEKLVKIGLIMPLTGDMKTFGESSKNGFLLALDKAGMVVGDYKIEYVIADDRNEATEAVYMTEKLISQDEVQAIVGPLTSETAIPASEVANANKVVLISNTATNPKVTVDNRVRKPYIFRACFVDPFQGEVGAKFAFVTLKAKTAAVMYDQGSDYTKGLAEQFKLKFEAMGGKVEVLEAYDPAEVDFTAALTNIADLNVDVLYLPDYYQKVSLIVKQARAKGVKAVFLGNGWDSPDLDYKAMDGGYFTNHYHASDTRPEVQAWVSEYKDKYGKVPDAQAALAYDATNLLLNAIKTANSNEPDKIKDAMQCTKNFPSVSGPTTFDENGNSAKAAAILQIKEGKQNFITSVNP